MEGLQEVDRIMDRISEHLKEGTSHYNRVYEEFYAIIQKKDRYRKMVENLTQDA